MSPRKRPFHMDPAVIEHAQQVVMANPRGAPETIKDVNPEPSSQERIPAPSVREEVPVVVSGPPCALEGAVVGAKCVVSRTDEGKAVRLLDPSGSVTLDKSDLFYTLPAGAKVRKAASDRYEVFRLGVQEPPLFVVESARDAVRRFLEVVV